MGMEEPHAPMREFMESLSASSFIFLLQVLRQTLSDLVSSPTDSFFPSSRIHGIVVINYLLRLHRLHRLHRLQCLQSSPEYADP